MDTTSPKKTKPNLYLDVDGVFFGLYGIGDEEPRFQLRPYANSFLHWAHERFNCKWLTCWHEKELLGHFPPELQAVKGKPLTLDEIAALPPSTLGLMALSYAHIALGMEYVNWKRAPLRYQPRETSSAEKIDAIDVENEDFYWLEDGIPQWCERILRKHKKLDRYLYVDERGPDGLLIAKAWLEKKLREPE